MPSEAIRCNGGMVDDDAALARTIIDGNSYMVLGTADAGGSAWASPVWFATDDGRDFYWVSSPQARHSRNLAVRPQLGIVIFDSTVPPGDGQAVYMSATAAELTGDDIDTGIDVFARGAVAAGLAAWTRENVVPPARHRIYRAVASEHFVLDEHDERVPVTLAPR
jgi:Pyridoxamine 5'-phosphate oxidase